MLIAASQAGPDYTIDRLLAMSDSVEVMSYSFRGHVNRGAYHQPYSGVGIEFDPLGVRPGRTGITLHESGFLPANDDWNFPAVFGPFWRLYYNCERGHCLVFGERHIELTPQHILLIPPHCLFHCLGGNPVPSFWMAFSFTQRPHPEQDVPILLPPRDTELCLIRDLEKLIAADEKWDPAVAIYRNSLALLQVVLSRPELRWQPPGPEPLPHRPQRQGLVHTQPARTSRQEMPQWQPPAGGGLRCWRGSGQVNESSCGLHYAEDISEAKY